MVGDKIGADETRLVEDNVGRSFESFKIAMRYMLRPSVPRFYPGLRYL